MWLYRYVIAILQIPAHDVGAAEESYCAKALNGYYKEI